MSNLFKAIAVSAFAFGAPALADDEGSDSNEGANVSPVVVERSAASSGPTGGTTVLIVLLLVAAVAASR